MNIDSTTLLFFLLLQANSKGFEPKYKVVEITKQDGIEET